MKDSAAKWIAFDGLLIYMKLHLTGTSSPFLQHLGTPLGSSAQVEAEERMARAAHSTADSASSSALRRSFGVKGGSSPG